MRSQESAAPTGASAGREGSVLFLFRRRRRAAARRQQKAARDAAEDVGSGVGAFQPRSVLVVEKGGEAVEKADEKGEFGRQDRVEIRVAWRGGDRERYEDNRKKYSVYERSEGGEGGNETRPDTRPLVELLKALQKRPTDGRTYRISSC